MKPQLIIDLAQIAKDKGFAPWEVEFVIKNEFEAPKNEPKATNTFEKFLANKKLTKSEAARLCSVSVSTIGRVGTKSKSPMRTIMFNRIMNTLNVPQELREAIQTESNVATSEENPAVAEAIINASKPSDIGYNLPSAASLIVCQNEGPRPSRELGFYNVTIYQHSLFNPREVKNYNGGSSIVYGIKFGFDNTEEVEKEIERATRCAYNDYRGSKPLPQFSWMKLDMRDGAYFGDPDKLAIVTSMTRLPVIHDSYGNIVAEIKPNAKANVKGYVTAMPPTSIKQAKFIYLVKEIEIL